MGMLQVRCADSKTLRVEAAAKTRRLGASLRGTQLAMRAARTTIRIEVGVHFAKVIRHVGPLSHRDLFFTPA